MNENMLFDCIGDSDEELDVGFALRTGEDDDALFGPAILDRIGYLREDGGISED